jgi:hypothetical protein
MIASDFRAEENLGRGADDRTGRLEKRAEFLSARPSPGATGSDYR